MSEKLLLTEEKIKLFERAGGIFTKYGSIDMNKLEPATDEIKRFLHDYAVLSEMRSQFLDKYSHLLDIDKEK